MYDFPLNPQEGDIFFTDDTLWKYWGSRWQRVEIGDLNSTDYSGTNQEAEDPSLPLYEHATVTLGSHDAVWNEIIEVKALIGAVLVELPPVIEPDDVGRLVVVYYSNFGQGTHSCGVLAPTGYSINNVSPSTGQRVIADLGTDVAVFRAFNDSLIFSEGHTDIRTITSN